jgi:hypothetical protein
MLKFNELVEGVEYWKEASTIHERATMHKIENGFFLDFYEYENNWKLSMLHVNDVLKSDYYKCEWVPKRDEFYYFPSFSKSTLYDVDYWNGDEYYLAIKRNVGVYRTAEEAIAKAKELGWT